MEYRTRRDKTEAWTEWRRLPASLLFSVFYLPTEFEFREDGGGIANRYAGFKYPNGDAMIIWVWNGLIRSRIVILEDMPLEGENIAWLPDIAS
jgi:hypothetical protein